MVTVVIPAFNEEKNIKRVINICKNEKYVDEIIVVNNLSTDKTKELALESGATVVDCNKQGKGYAMEKGIETAKGDIIAFLDADIPNYMDNIVHKLVEPIINKDIDFVKATFKREGGRITELVAKPLLNILFPDIYKFSQPLSGMIAGKKEIFNQIALEKDYGVDIGILLDVIKLNASIVEVNVGEIKNVSKDWKLLSYMAEEVMRAIIKRSSLKC